MLNKNFQAKSNFISKLITVDKVKMIIIEDLYNDSNEDILHYKTVTNNIEDVLKEIKLNNAINLNEYVVIYLDSDNIWNGYRPLAQTWFFLGEISEQDAINLYLEKFRTDK